MLRAMVLRQTSAMDKISSINRLTQGAEGVLGSTQDVTVLYPTTDESIRQFGDDNPPRAEP